MYGVYHICSYFVLLDQCCPCVTIQLNMARSRFYLIPAIAAALLVAGIYLFQSTQSPPPASDGETVHSYEVPVNGYDLGPPAKNLPPPAKERAYFDRLYTVSSLQFRLSWSVRNVPRNPIIGNHVFDLELYNTLNKTVIYDPPASAHFFVGCIARDNPFTTLSFPTLSYTFSPYETKHIPINIDVSCLYLGTSDSHYFWRIY